MAMEHERLPAGYRLVASDEIDSTNSEAMRRAMAGDPGRLWLVARSQSRGRGRSGRDWVSVPGNLYASVLLRLGVPLAQALELPLVAGVACHDAVRAVAPGLGRGEPELKWPNDVLLGGAKLAGILAESTSRNGVAGTVVVIGFGINLAHRPAELGERAVALSARGYSVTPRKMLQALACSFSRWLGTWDAGRGLEMVRRAWLGRAMAPGRAISVKTGDGEISGTFAGLAADGALLLTDCDGVPRRITYGDVVLHR